MDERKRRPKKDRPISVSWTSHYTPTRVHYVRDVSVAGLAAVALDRSVMLFSVSTFCGLDVPTQPAPKYGAYIEGSPPVCRHCATRYAKMKPTSKPTP
jgi:hypothetical protein